MTKFSVCFDSTTVQFFSETTYFRSFSEDRESYASCKRNSIPRGYSHILAVQVCAAGKGMVFKPFALG